LLTWKKCGQTDIQRDRQKFKCKYFLCVALTFKWSSNGRCRWAERKLFKEEKSKTKTHLRFLVSGASIHVYKIKSEKKTEFWGRWGSGGCPERNETWRVSWRSNRTKSYNKVNMRMMHVQLHLTLHMWLLWPLYLKYLGSENHVRESVCMCVWERERDGWCKLIGLRGRITLGHSDNREEPQGREREEKKIWMPKSLTCNIEK
jgi:hypothetical protein